MGRKRKKTTRKKKSQSSGLVSLMAKWLNSEWMLWCKERIGVAVLLLVLAGGVIFGFGQLENYVGQIAQQRQVALTVELKDPPKWISEHLISEICLSTKINSNDDLLDESLTQEWAANLSKNPWIKRVKKIHKRYDGRVVLDCDIRRPLAKVQRNNKTVYIDLEGVVLPYSPTYGHLVTLRGHPSPLPQPGESISASPMIAGIEVLQQILNLDEKLAQEHRLWQELASIDVSNYQGQRDRTLPHLVLYTQGNTEIRWGAAVGNYLPYYEASDLVKLTTLYREFKHAGSLDQYQYIELRNHRKEKADPLKQT